MHWTFLARMNIKLEIIVANKNLIKTMGTRERVLMVCQFFHKSKFEVVIFVAYVCDI